METAGGAFGAAAINGGTIANATVSGTTNAVYTPSGVGAMSAIPFIHLSTGSVAAGGGISGITALALTYANAYCWFPANALAASIAAGWYYCTFSSATAGTAFLNTYTSGAPTIPTSPTPVVAGQGAFTSDTATHSGPTMTLPAGAMGINGRVRIQQQVSYTNSGGAKTFDLTFGGTTFTGPSAVTTTLYSNYETVIANRGVANIQQGNTGGTNGGGAVVAVTPALAAIDTTAAVIIALRITKSVATDNAVIDRYSIEAMYAA